MDNVKSKQSMIDVENFVNNVCNDVVLVKCELNSLNLLSKELSEGLDSTKNRVDFSGESISICSERVRRNFYIFLIFYFPHFR